MHWNGKCYQQLKKKKLTHNVDVNKGSSITTRKMHTRTHARTHTHTQTDRGEGQCCLTEIFWEQKCLEFAFEGRESSLMSWGRLFQMWRPKCEKVRKPWKKWSAVNVLWLNVLMILYWFDDFLLLLTPSLIFILWAHYCFVCSFSVLRFNVT